MSDEPLFLDKYARFFSNRDRSSGPNFHERPLRSLPPPIVQFGQKLRWWSIDRWRRLKKVRQERDRRLQEILRLRQHVPLQDKTETEAE